MNDETKSKLDAMFSKKEHDVNAAETRNQESRRDVDAFMAEFKELRTRVIRPVMEDISTYLKGRGHACEIDEQEETPLPHRTRQNAEIRFWITPNSDVATKTDSYPSIGFVAAVFGKKIMMDASTMHPGRGGSASSKGEYAVSQITVDLVEKKIAEAVADIFK